jgi:hypothetical protein
MPTLNLPADELAAVGSRQSVASSKADRYPHASRLDLLRAALARLEAAATKPSQKGNPEESAGFSQKAPQEPSAAKADKRARR